MNDPVLRPFLILAVVSLMPPVLLIAPRVVSLPTVPAITSYAAVSVDFTRGGAS